MPKRTRIFALIWLAGTFGLLLLLSWNWISVSPEDRPLKPRTPIDGTNRHFAPQWQFLAEARVYVPPGRTFTVVGPERDADMSLFMMSLGLLPDRMALPWSYWNRVRPEYSGQAEYVLVYYRNPPHDPELEMIGQLSFGSVLKRRQP